MIGLAEGIAHVSFVGGGLFIPARSPYDREVLVEHILDRVRMKGNVQVLVDNRRWLVNLLEARCATGCSSCGSNMTSVCSDTAVDGVVYCVPCAFARHRTFPSRLRSKGPAVATVVTA